MSFEWNFVLVGLAQMVSFFVQGCAGFGSAALSAPVTNGVLGTAMGVPYGCTIVIPFLIFLFAREWRRVVWREAAKMVLIGAPGLVAGHALFYALDPAATKLCIAAIVIAVAAMNAWRAFRPGGGGDGGATGHDPAWRRGLRYAALVGGSMVEGAFSIGGPLVTIYSVKSIGSKEGLRATMTLYWIVMCSWNAVTHLSHGMYTPELVSAMAVGLPFAAAGFALGMACMRRVNRDQFLRIVYIALLAVGIGMLVQSVGALAWG